MQHIRFLIKTVTNVYFASFLFYNFNKKTMCVDLIADTVYIQHKKGDVANSVCTVLGFQSVSSF